MHARHHQREEEHRKHLAAHRGADFFRRHAHFLHQLKAYAVVVALGNLLVIDDHGRGHQKQQAQEDAQEEKAAVEFLYALLIERRAGNAYAALCQQVRAQGGLLVYARARVHIEGIHVFHVGGVVPVELDLQVRDLPEGVRVRNDEIIQLCAHVVRGVDIRRGHVGGHIEFQAKDPQLRLGESVRPPRRRQQHLALLQLVGVVHQQVVVRQREHRELHDVVNRGLHGVGVVLGHEREAAFPVSHGREGQAGIHLLVQWRIALLGKDQPRRRAGGVTAAFAVRIGAHAEIARVPGEHFVHARVERCGGAHHHQHHGGEDADASQTRGVLLHAVDHARNRDKVLRLIIIGLVAPQQLERRDAGAGEQRVSAQDHQNHRQEEQDKRPYRIVHELRQGIARGQQHDAQDGQGPVGARFALAHLRAAQQLDGLGNVYLPQVRKQREEENAREQQHRHQRGAGRKGEAPLHRHLQDVQEQQLHAFGEQ